MYTVDAVNAVATHPTEWSFDPWSADDADKARSALHDKQVEEAAAAGRPTPPSPPPLAPLSPADEEMVSNDAKARADAAARVKARKEADEKKRLEDMQFEQDQALLNTPSPAPERRPFGRPGPLTPAEREAMERKKAAQAAKDQEAADKAAQTGGMRNTVPTDEDK